MCVFFLDKMAIHRHRAGFEPQRASPFRKRVKAPRALGEANRAWTIIPDLLLLWDLRATTTRPHLACQSKICRSRASPTFAAYTTCSKVGPGGWEFWVRRRIDLVGLEWRFLAYPYTDSFSARCLNREERSSLAIKPLSCLLWAWLFAMGKVISNFTWLGIPHVVIHAGRAEWRDE
jgi:hypothetical protein